MNSEKKECPYCGEQISTTAKKCQFCGEWLEGATETENNYQNSDQLVNQTEKATFPDTKIDYSLKKLKVTYEDAPKSFFEAYFLDSLVKQYATFSGRSTRKEFWLTYVALMVISIGVTGICLIIAGLGGYTGILAATVIASIYSLSLLLPTLAMCCRRLRDAGINPWLILILLIPVIGSVVLLVMLCFPSKFLNVPKWTEFNILDKLIIVICLALFGIGIWSILNSMSIISMLGSD